ncbi:MAG: signal peptide peptidase SppA, partial [Planctomycetaceae bacterium]|nr:signal peptide peptidase SppA [Planctomycetaceae bacterium]
VSGTIVEGDEFPKEQLDKIKEDKHVKAVVLRINSPGGTVTQSDYLLHHLREVKKERDLPVVVSMGSLCASGGYYIAMAVGDQEDAIFAEPTTWTGSIGVIIPHYNVGKLMDTWGVDEDSVASGEFKQMGTPTREMTDEERALFQQLVDETYQHFREVVKSGRPAFRADDAALDAVAKGQVFTANQALEKGLVDKIGF